MSEPRPRLLLGLGLALLCCAFAAPALLAQNAADYAAVRLGFRVSLNGGDTNLSSDSTYAGKITSLNSDAQTAWNNLVKTAGRAVLWNDLPISTTKSDTLTSSFGRVRTMAVAYATPGAALYRNTALRDDILSAMEWLNANHYLAGRAFYDNWFPWHLGVPLNVADIFACIHDGVTDTARRSALYSAYAAAIDHYQNTAGRTYSWSGANLVWRAKIDYGLGAALESSTRLALGRDRLSARAGVGNERNVFAYVTSGDGFYVDGSFIQHNTHAYTGAYGLYLLNELAVVLEVAAGTPWAVADPLLANVYRWIDDAFDPVLYRGGIMAHTQGREIARSGSTEHNYGHVALAAAARLARFAPAADAARLRALVKQHLQSDAYRNFLNTASLPASVVVKPLLTDNAIIARSPRQGLFVFAGMDRVVAQRGDWAYALSLSSSRISKYESINGENLRGWYLGDGAAYLYNGDLAQYSDAYWPTVNPYRLAGVTLDNRARADAGASSPNTRDPRTTKSWVGGSSVDGLYGAAGMDHEAAQSDLRGKLSWFFFDDEVVHLGAGIVTSSSNPNRVESVVMNRMIGHAGNNSGGAYGVTFTANGVARAATAGATESLAGVTHAHLNAALQTAYGPGSVGYYFPVASPLQVLREARTGKWSDINVNGSTTAITRNFLALWFDHGVGPLSPGASFSYAVLPNKTAAQTAAYQQNPDIEILANTSSVQAAREKNLRVTAANFWSATPAAPGSVDGITADRPCSVSLRYRDGQVVLGVSDPTQTLSSATPLVLELPVGASARLSSDSGVTVLALSPRIRLSINLASTRGRSLAAAFNLAPLTAAPDTAFASPGLPIRINVLANDSSSSGGALTVSSATFAPPAAVAASPHGVAILDAATASAFPVGAANFIAATGAAAPGALSTLPGFTALAGWRDATRAFPAKGSVNTGVTSYHLRSDAAKTALRFQIEANTASNPSAGGATTTATLSGSAGDALYVGAVGPSFGHVAITLGAYSAVSQDAAALGFRTTSAADGRPYASRALGFVVAGVGAGRSFTAEFRGVRGQLLSTQTATATVADTRLFFGLDAGPVEQEWIHSVVLRGNNANANVGLDDVGFTPVAAVNVGSLAFVDELPVYTAPAGYTGPARFAYTVTDGVDSAGAEVSITVSGTPVAISSATASTWQDPNTPDKVLDGVTDASVSRWSGYGDGATLTLTLAARQKVGALNISTFQGTVRRAVFDVETSDDDGATWTRVFSGSSSGTTSDLERVRLTPTWARLVRIVGRGYVRNDGLAGDLWNSIGEVHVLADANLAPQAPAVALAGRAGETLTLDLGALASDPDAGPSALVVSALGAPSAGSVQNLGGGLVRYTPPAGHRGRVTFAYTISDGDAAAANSVALDLGIPVSADGFFTLYFDGAEREDPSIGGFDSDPDGDGLANLIEYALGSDPRSPAATGVTASLSGGALRLSFPRSRYAADLVYTVEASSDLVTWTALATASALGPWQNTGGAQAIAQTVADDATWQVQVTDSAPASPRRFLRLRVGN